MIAVTCDMCGKSISSLTNRVDLELTYDGVLSLGLTGFRNTGKQLCIECATRLCNWIDDCLEKETLKGGDTK